MNALSLWQPWATLWLLSDPDEKVFETRHWYTGYRGPLLVYATKKRDGEVRAMLEEPLVRERLAAHGLSPKDLTYGALIGKVNLVGCCQMLHMPPPSEREQAFGNWEPARYALERGPDPQLWKTPIPWVGKQAKFMTVPDVLVRGAA